MQMVSPLDLLATMSLVQVIVAGVILNFIICAFGIMLYQIVHFFVDKKRYREEFESIRTHDVLLVLSSLFCNAVIFVVGVLLFQSGLITFKQDPGIYAIVSTFIIFIVTMDILMYIFHRIAHLGWIYRFVHATHHSHVKLNCLSVFVLHPLEALGFGLLLILVVLSFDLNIYGVVLYLLVNLLWGTIGHFNFTVFSRVNNLCIFKYIGTASFHHTHHKNPQVNFGFYTTLWDRLARSFAK